MIGTPPPPQEDRRSPLTPQLALRAAIVGSFALGMFAIIFFRLWFLQVLSGDQYVKAANVNRVRDIKVAAERGEVLDRSGAVLVDSIKTLAVQISPPDLPVPASLADIATLEHPPAADQRVYDSLSHVLRIPTRARRCQLHMPQPNVFSLSPVACLVGQQVSLLPYADVTIRKGSAVNRDVQFYLAERQRQFPGVQVQRIYVTHYPDTTLAAQVLGYVGPISPTEHAMKTYSGLPQDSIIGQTGIEAQYDSFLRGTDGYQRVQVNSLGQPVGDLPGKAPVTGHYLRLSLDANLERVGQAALAHSLSLNNSPGGAFVAMNPTNGEVYGMGSLPSYDPSIFTGNLSQSKYNQLIGPNSGDPLLNRAIQSAGPSGSTFKPITATAAMESGAWSPGQIYDDTGQFCIGSGLAQQCRHNAQHASFGPVDISGAIKVSSDDFFYNLGALTNPNPYKHPSGGPVDTWAYRFGIGRTTGVDLPDESIGTLPTPTWRSGRNQLEAQCDSATGPFRWTNGTNFSAHYHKDWHRGPKHAAGGCGIADGTNRPWSVGDNINLAVGQGDVQLTPVQLAVVYSALANGGTIVRPHLGLDVQQRDGTVLQTISPPATRHISINSGYLDAIRTGLREAASQQGGTSADVMGDFPAPVYGKTGTAQYIVNGVEQDYGWYACFVPSSINGKPPIVVVVKVEKGGFGDVAAAPVARQILSQWFFGKPGPYKAGSSTSL